MRREPFSPARLAALRAAGRPVFVNMTAAWCVSCLVNERVALSPGAVKAAFAQRGVAYLKGDWTRPDPAISAYLRDHGREGVPLYVYYPPGGEGEVLPQILTEAGVLRRVAARLSWALRPGWRRQRRCVDRGRKWRGGSR